MGLRFFIAIACLLSLWSEIALNSSTIFVRVSPPSVVGRLAMIENYRHDEPSVAHAVDDSVTLAPDRATSDEPDATLTRSSPSHKAGVAVTAFLKVFFGASPLAMAPPPVPITADPAIMQRPPCA